MAQQDEVQIPQLPEHHGQVPVGVVTSITGTSSRLFRPLSTDEKVLLLVEATVKEEGHRSVIDGLHRIHKLQVVDLFELTGDKGQKLLGDAKRQAGKLDDLMKAREPLPGINDGEDQVDDDDLDDDDPLKDIVDDGGPKGGRK
jgi:hypothetical protein